jgi:hypothetical protein
MIATARSFNHNVETGISGEEDLAPSFLRLPSGVINVIAPRL